MLKEDNGTMFKTVFADIERGGMRERERERSSERASARARAWGEEGRKVKFS